MSLLWLYKKGMTLGAPMIRSHLKARARRGKENPMRLGERQGIAARPRPPGTLVWIHAASVGEAQSMLTLIHLIAAQMPQAQILVTSITTTSAQLLEARLPAGRAFHQFAPVDHPAWVRRFLDHWQPDLALWAESELWPNTLTLLKKRNIPVALLNAHMSAKSFRNWSKALRLAEDMLSVFTVILAQSAVDAERYHDLGGRSIVLTDNIKYGASPLPVEDADLQALKKALGVRPIWLFASTHAGEEAMACQVHIALQARFPNVLTIIAPRHPSRRAEIELIIRDHQLTYTTRSERKFLPIAADQIYLCDTLGELGLLYRAAPLACIGRSFSADGGGGHNPVEAALLGCGVLHGPWVQNLAEIYNEMDESGAARKIAAQTELVSEIASLLASPEKLKALRESGYDFAMEKNHSLAVIAQELEPLFLQANLPVLRVPA